MAKDRSKSRAIKIRARRVYINQVIFQIFKVKNLLDIKNMPSFLHFFEANRDCMVDTNSWETLKLNFGSGGGGQRSPCPTGPTGPTGQQGPQGLQGLQGPQGLVRKGLNNNRANWSAKSYWPNRPTGPVGQGALPLARSGAIQNEPVNSPNTNILGTYAWYKLHDFQSVPNTQGVEFIIYMLVCRGLNSTSQIPGFTLLIPTPFA
jgi:hypothetical protein